MNRTLTVIPQYKKLVSEIASLYEGARKALVEAYWQIGRRIVEVEQQGAVKAAYGSRLIAKLSHDLMKQLGSGFSESQLWDMRKFYLLNKKIRPAGELSWTQHVALMRIGDNGKRKSLEEKAIREVLSRDDVRKLVRQELVREQVAGNLAAWERTSKSSQAVIGARATMVRSEDEVPYGSPNRQLLEPVRGTLYAYRIIQPKLVGEGESELLIDLGFSSYRSVRDIKISTDGTSSTRNKCKDLDSVTSRGLKPGDIVSSSKDASGRYVLAVNGERETGNESRGLPRSQNGERPTVNESRLALPVHRLPLPAALYTYKASVERVVDGDTLRVVVDLGFGFKTRQYLRLRGLDCPEIDTPEGKKAADFVRSRIKTADQIVLTSSRSDKYDRYLADIFFVDDKGREVYLNNALLEQGFAVRMRE